MKAQMQTPMEPMTRHDSQAIVLFDGVCNLCNSTVQWIISHDRKRVFQFASLQSQAAREVLQAAAAPKELPDSVILVKKSEAGAQVLSQSDAAIGIARVLGLPWSLLVVGLVLPRVLRDAMYSYIARNRYRWFGKRDACMMPTPELRARFLDAQELKPAAATDAAHP